METSPEKEYSRKLSADDWIREMKARAERQEFEPLAFIAEKIEKE